MTVTKEKREAILAKIVAEIGEKGEAFSPAVFARQEKTTAQSVYRYLAMLDERGMVRVAGAGRKKTYALATQTAEKTFPIAGLTEETVWRVFAAPFFAPMSAIIRMNFGYAFHEILNNALEHSRGNSVRVRLRKDAFRLAAWIIDDGVGIFSNIAQALKLEDKTFAILELAKGKFTTAPQNHTGEGIFFSSKMVDDFAIAADGIVWGALPEDVSRPAGTAVYMAIRCDHAQSSQEIFNAFAQSADDFNFSKTLVLVKLLEYGEEIPLVVSRSQARRLTARFEQFKAVVLDFSGIEEIGQGFADELFRVFVNQHPEVKLLTANCAPAVQRMIAHVCGANRPAEYDGA